MASTSHTASVRSAVLQTSALCRLPAELRNTIYGHLFPDSLVVPRISFEAQDPNLPSVTSILRTCQDIHSEAAPWLYARSLFILRVYCRPYCMEDRLKTFLTNLGRYARMLRNISIQFKDGNPYDCWTAGPLFLGDGSTANSDVLRVTQLLRPTWNLNLNNLTIVFEDPDAICMRPENFSAFNKAFRALQHGEAKKYGRFIEEIGINIDGSGGTLCWGSSSHQGRYRIRLDRMNVIPFSIGPDSILQLQSPTKVPSLMTLPEPVRTQILDLVLCPSDALEIDVDKSTGSLCGLVRTSRELYMAYRDKFLFDKSLIISISTTESRTTFSNFFRLQLLLRKPFHTISYDSNPPHVEWGDGSITITGTAQFNLNFKLESVDSLENLRISILPFVMETSSFSGKSLVAINIFQWFSRRLDGRPDVTHRIDLQTLRINVTESLMQASFGGSSAGVPEIWIDGRGKVVESNATRKFASDIPNFNFASTISSDDDARFSVDELHPKDVEYRGYRANASIIHPKCQLYDLDQFFPFARSPRATLRYLMYVLEREVEECTFRRVFKNPPEIECWCSPEDCWRPFPEI